VRHLALAAALCPSTRYLFQDPLVQKMLKKHIVHLLSTRAHLFPVTLWEFLAPRQRGVWGSVSKLTVTLENRKTLYRQVFTQFDRFMNISKREEFVPEAFTPSGHHRQGQGASKAPGRPPQRMDPLQWWAGNAEQFSSLAVFAKWTLASQTSSSQAERVFSQAALILRKHRASMLSTRFAKYVFLRTNRNLIRYMQRGHEACQEDATAAGLGKEWTF